MSRFSIARASFAMGEALLALLRTAAAEPFDYFVYLNRETVQHLLEFLVTADGRYMMDFFKHVWAPDEFFFHTLILNSVEDYA
jgi:hypothetical protein